jgi:hypothetical protein
MKKLLLLIPCLLYLLVNHIYKKEFAALVCLQTTTEKGNPIAGIGIYSQQKDLGCSDSFGEWCSLLESDITNTVTLNLRKKHVAIDKTIEVILPHKSIDTIDKVSKTIILIPQRLITNKSPDNTAWIKLDNTIHNEKNLSLVKKIQDYYIEENYQLDPESENQIFITKRKSDDNITVVISNDKYKKNILNFKNNISKKQIIKKLKPYL